jgi:histidinol-phosphate aminotransferase
VANFVYVEVGEDASPLFDALMREGVIVRPLRGFGAPGAIRVTVGTPEENEYFGEALARVLSRSPAA